MSQLWVFIPGLSFPGEREPEIGGAVDHTQRLRSRPA